MIRIFSTLLLFWASSPLFAQIFTSSDLPLVLLETGGQAIGDEPKQAAQMRIIHHGPSQRNQLSDPANVYEGPIGIEVRGASTQLYDQKSYSFELRDADGQDLDRSLLGLPEGSDFVLRACFADKSLIRDALSYQLSNEMGRWASHTRFCEVFLNGDYQGVYVLLESIKRGPTRLNLDKMKASDTTDLEVTGGFITKVDRWEEGPGFIDFSPLNGDALYFHYMYPKGEDIHKKQARYLQNYFILFQAALISPASADTALGWRKYADEGSFIDHYLLNELAKNVDSYRLSGFYHKDKGGKLQAGPAWDFNFSWRNADYCDNWYPFGWTYNTCPWGVPFWWTRLPEQDTAYANHLYCRWKSLRQGVFSQERVHALVDSLAGVVAEAQARHFKRWPILGQYVWPNPAPLAQNHTEEIWNLKSWASARLVWMDENLPGECGERPKPPVFPADWLFGPNPVSETLRVQGPQFVPFKSYVELYDPTGRRVYRGDIEGSGKEISMENLAQGLYLLVLRTGLGEIFKTVRVVKI